MRVAIISDIHDNIPKLRAALEGLRDVGALVCLGDLCSPFIMKEIGEGFSGPTHVVFGNNDGDLYRITECARRYPHVTIHGEFAELELGGRRFAVNHFDGIGRALVRSGSYDVVCFGHNHRYEVARQDATLIVNPGEIYGGLTGRSTFVIYDTETSKAIRKDL